MSRDPRLNQAQRRAQKLLGALALQLARVTRRIQVLLTPKLIQLAQVLKLDRISRRIRIPRGKIPVYVGAGLALLGVGMVTAMVSPGGTAANAGTAAIGRAGTAASAGSAGHAGGGDHPGGPGGAGGQARPATWGAVVRAVAANTDPRPSNGQLGPADRLHPAGLSGPQAVLPMTADRWASARTIVTQALAKKMGLRAAVVAIATSMQESTLLNLPYGDRDSLGLFQQRPSCGWGTPRQILRPAYAADAFLNALKTYQANNPGWASQPLWQSAQGVQQSGFPYAYAKWEAQASSIVGSIATQLVR